MLPPPAASPEHLTGQQPAADAASADLLERQIPHLQVPQHGGLQEEPGGTGKTPEANWIQQLVRNMGGMGEGLLVLMSEEVSAGQIFDSLRYFSLVLEAF